MTVVCGGCQASRASRHPFFAAAGPGWDEPAFMGGGRRSGTGSRLPIVPANKIGFAARKL